MLRRPAQDILLRSGSDLILEACFVYFEDAKETGVPLSKSFTNRLFSPALFLFVSWDLDLFAIACRKISIVVSTLEKMEPALLCLL